MQAITMYVANDGSKHETAEQAQARDDLIIDTHVALRSLKPVPDASGFSNGSGYVQQSPDAVRECKRQLLAIAKRTIGGYDHMWDAPVDEVHPMGIAGRVINDAGAPPLDRAWYRLCCIDAECREWGHPYFALNPGQGTQVALA